MDKFDFCTLGFVYFLGLPLLLLTYNALLHVDNEIL